MAFVCLCVVAVFLSLSTSGFTQSYQQNVYSFKSDSRTWKANEHIKVNVSVNLKTVAREVSSRFVSIALDSSLVNYHWLHFDFRYSIDCFFSSFSVMHISAELSSVCLCCLKV